LLDKSSLLCKSRLTEFERKILEKRLQFDETVVRQSKMSSKISTDCNDNIKVDGTPIKTQWINLKWEPRNKAKTALASRCSTVTKI